MTDNIQLNPPNKVIDVLIVDDDQSVNESICQLMKDEGLSYLASKSSQDALGQLETVAPKVAIVDVVLQGSDHNGLQLMDIMSKKYPRIPVIIMSGNVLVDPGEMRKHAYDYVQKPFRAHHIIATVRNAISYISLREEHEELKHVMGKDISLVGESPKWVAVREKIKKVAENNGRVLVMGARGVGKELIARNIHAMSHFRGGDFVKFCVCDYEPSEVHEKLFGGLGKEGAIQKAQQGGVLFISDVHALPLKCQEKLSHFLANHVMGKDNQCHFKLITATNEDLSLYVKERRFREDLYHRISSLFVEVPPLKDRKQDIPALIQHMMKGLAWANGLDAISFSEASMALLQSYDWPGNVLQLRNTLEALLISCACEDKDEIKESMIPDYISSNKKDNSIDYGRFISLPIRKAREMFEKEYIKIQLDRCGGQVSEAAKRMEMERTALYRKLKDLNIDLKPTK